MLRTIFFEIFRIVEHNPEHYIQLNILGENVNACSRCLGAYIVGLVLFFPFFYIAVYTDIVFDFWLIFITSYLLASVTLIDFTSVDIFKMREGSNRFRFFAGILLGLSVMLYLFFLPVSLLVRIGSLVIYNIIAIGIATYAEMKHGKTQADTNQ